MGTAPVNLLEAYLSARYRVRCGRLSRVLRIGGIATLSFVTHGTPFAVLTAWNPGSTLGQQP